MTWARFRDKQAMPLLYALAALLLLLSFCVFR